MRIFAWSSVKEPAVSSDGQDVSSDFADLIARACDHLSGRVTRRSENDPTWECLDCVEDDALLARYEP